MEEYTRNGVTVECVKGDITAQDDMDAIVNAANAQLRTGGGVAGAIHGAAGPELTEATREYAPIEPGEAVMTPAFDLPNDHVIHCLGPVYGQDHPEEELLASCYRQALRLADEEGLSSVAFPALSTGAFGYPMKEAATVALRTVFEATEDLQHVDRVRFVLWGEDAHEVHAKTLRELTD